MDLRAVHGSEMAVEALNGMLLGAAIVTAATIPQEHAVERVHCHLRPSECPYVHLNSEQTVEQMSAATVAFSVVCAVPFGKIHVTK